MTGNSRASLIGLIVLLLTACTQQGQGSDPSQANISITGARVVVAEDSAHAVLVMTLLSSRADSITAIAIDDPEPVPFQLFAGFEDESAGQVGPTPEGPPEPVPTGPVPSVDVEADTPVTFGVDGYGAILESWAGHDADTTTVHVTIEFRDQDPATVNAEVTS